MDILSIFGSFTLNCHVSVYCKYLKTMELELATTFVWVCH